MFVTVVGIVTTTMPSCLSRRLAPSFPSFLTESLINRFTQLTGLCTLIYLANMCYGIQEWYTHCRRGGVFHITDHCVNPICYTLIEDNAAHLYGWCPICIANRKLTPNLVQRELTRFTSISELNSHYGQKLRASLSSSERLLVRFQEGLAEGGKGCRLAAHHHKKSVQHFAYLEECRKKDLALYKADEMKKNDTKNHGQAAEVQKG